MITSILLCQRCFSLQNHRSLAPHDKRRKLGLPPVDVRVHADEETETETGGVEGDVALSRLRPPLPPSVAEYGEGDAVLETPLSPSLQQHAFYTRGNGGRGRRRESAVGEGEEGREDFVLSPDEVAKKIVKHVKAESLVLKVVDLLDLESSVVPSLFEGLRSKQCTVIWVVNKIDCLPKGTPLDMVKLWVRRMVRQIRNVVADDVVLISAAKGLGLQTLEDRMKAYCDASNPKWIYVVGRTNSGKSTLLNRFLHFIGYSYLGRVQHKKALGGVTRSAIPGTTLYFLPFGLPRGFKLIDTPGVPSTHQITSLLKFEEDLYQVVPSRRLLPISFGIQEGRSLLLGALCRFDLVDGGPAVFSAFCSNQITISVCRTSKAPDLLRRKACTHFFPPHSLEDFERLQPFVRHRVEVQGEHSRAYDDLCVAGLGWISVTGSGTKTVDVWVPKGVKVFRRPSMLPYEVRTRGVCRWSGKTPRGRTPKMKDKKHKMVAELERDEERRELFRRELEEKEARRLSGAIDLVPDEVGEGTGGDTPNSPLMSPSDIPGLIESLESQWGVGVFRVGTPPREETVCLEGDGSLFEVEEDGEVHGIDHCESGECVSSAVEGDGSDVEDEEEDLVILRRRKRGDDSGLRRRGTRTEEGEEGGEDEAEFEEELGNKEDSRRCRSPTQS
uniref:Uncharacterized protein n=1 Tax=Chromera velia CCMP2878 TaxID=1169474 RepID=A0A0G4H2Z4_9ALVE|eukprot:Cvel_24494.t1-p1 / transcript=Cvel_24494.t1 / gene=Cvel_24494 / organism=Chromera_velia_CCMP2878 / gene_product=Uncharacterized protein YqeH, putative / transcript_product=Uncharacterized protein YqeH, putative / location=Cvel_scaffold2656:5712-8796(+) / protein_length=669 / sequence_SO=supercontig / SO=protein_coding / is_pseudo=false